MTYSGSILVYAVCFACVGRCLTPPASSKVDAAPQDDQGPGLALIYGWGQLADVLYNANLCEPMRCQGLSRSTQVHQGG